MFKYILSPAAQKSLQQIRSYSLSNFGKQQTIIYLKRLHDRMQYLADQPAQPAQGKVRDDIKAGYYSHFEGSHTIYYRIRDTDIDIIDVLHQSMDPARHL